MGVSSRLPSFPVPQQIMIISTTDVDETRKRRRDSHMTLKSESPDPEALGFRQKHDSSAPPFLTRLRRGRKLSGCPHTLYFARSTPFLVWIGLWSMYSVCTYQWLFKRAIVYSFLNVRTDRRIPLCLLCTGRIIDTLRTE